MHLQQQKNQSLTKGIYVFIAHYVLIKHGKYHMSCLDMCGTSSDPAPGSRRWSQKWSFTDFTDTVVETGTGTGTGTKKLET